MCQPGHSSTMMGSQPICSSHWRHPGQKFSSWAVVLLLSSVGAGAWTAGRDRLSAARVREAHVHSAKARLFRKLVASRKTRCQTRANVPC